MKASSGFSVFRRGDDSGSSAGNGPEAAGLAYLLKDEYAVRSIDLPPLPAAEIRGFIRYRLTRLYPGTSDDIRFEIVDGGRGGAGPRQVLVAAAATIEAIRARTPRGKIVSVLSGFPAPETDSGRIAVLDDRIESALRISGQWTALESRPYSADGFAAAVAAMRAEVPAVQVFYDGAARTAAELRGPPDCQYIDFRSVSAAARRGELPAFGTGLSQAAPLSRNRTRLGLAAVFVLLNLIAVFARLDADTDTAYYRASAANVSRLSGLVMRYDAAVAESLRARTVDAADGGSITPYALLSDFARAASVQVRISSLTMERGAFVIEAETPNALALLRGLAGSPEFAALRLSRVQALPAGGEGVSVSGEYHDLP
jgi:hypothetical protein